MTSGLRQTPCLVIKPKSGAPLSCLDRSGTSVKVWGRWVGLSVVCIPCRHRRCGYCVPVRRAFSREALLGKPTKEYSNGKH